MKTTYIAGHRVIFCGVNQQLVGNMEFYDCEFTITRHPYTRKYRIAISSRWALERQKGLAILGRGSKSANKAEKLQEFLVSRGLDRIPEDILATLK